MGWSIGFDAKRNRDIGYGVPALCDHPNCEKEIDRGLGYVCGSEPYGGEHGCGLFFCPDHKTLMEVKDEVFSVCDRCLNNQPAYEPKRDIKKWREWKLTHDSWAQWRIDNPELAAELK